MRFALYFLFSIAATEERDLYWGAEHLIVALYGFRENKDICSFAPTPWNFMKLEHSQPPESGLLYVPLFLYQ